MKTIDREDMLELTRRMTVKRNCFSRIAGMYADGDGFIDGTFHRHFLKLTADERAKNLELAKAVPFGKTNVNLKGYEFTEEGQKPGSVWQLLMALLDCELKNDALLDVFYDVIAEKYHSKGDYAFYIFYGTYDVPLKANDKESLWESEEVYQFLVGVFCPVSGDYEPGNVECGFLFPAFCDRSGDLNRIHIYQSDEHAPHKELVDEIIRGLQ